MNITVYIVMISETMSGVRMRHKSALLTLLLLTICWLYSTSFPFTTTQHHPKHCHHHLHHQPLHHHHHLQHYHPQPCIAKLKHHLASTSQTEHLTAESELGWSKQKKKNLIFSTSGFWFPVLIAFFSFQSFLITLLYSPDKQNLLPQILNFKLD